MKISRMIKISRPIFWIIAPLIFFVPFYLEKKTPGIIAIIQMILLSFPYCFFLFGINDRFDYLTDRKNPRKGSIHGSIIKRKEFKSIYFFSLIFVILFLLTSLVQLNVINIIFSILLVGVSYYYSAKPIRFKEIPPFDSLSNSLIIYLIFGLGYSHISSNLIIPRWDIYPLLLCVAAIHMFSTIMDYTPDKESGTRTSAVVFGIKNTALFSTVIIGMSLINLHTKNNFIISFLLISMIFFGSVYIFDKEKLASRIMVLEYFLFIVCAGGYLIF